MLVLMRGAALIGMLTTEHRDTWATLRVKLILAHPDNEAALQAVERSMFLLVLEGACPPAIEEQAKTMFLGDGRNRCSVKALLRLTNLLRSKLRRLRSKLRLCSSAMAATGALLRLN
jgi:hypothetical protein